ncbi:MAG TPA: methyltransferase domain-containing protein [Pseudobacter sp.]|nr:methyltransferase domain-containing protein [Pseudobacter sp.]
MQPNLLSLLRCPVTRSSLELQVIHTSRRTYDGKDVEIIETGFLFGENNWCYPIIGGIPRLIVEAMLVYEQFMCAHLPDFRSRKEWVQQQYPGLLQYVEKKNRKTRQSFTQEWGIFNYEEDKVWDADATGMLNRFLQETDETRESIRGKMILDAGCGNGLLNQLVAGSGATILGMDFSQSIERAWQQNRHANALFIQGDVQYPPVSFEAFDIVHSSGVLICTNNTELSFSCIDPCVKTGGKMSVWLYHPRKDFIHNTFNFTRKFTSKLPLKLQYYLYLVTIFPASYVVKKIKGNPQNRREMMIDILDWFSPEFRWEHHPDESASWFSKRQYSSVKVTTNEVFGFNMTGIKNSRIA